MASLPWFRFYSEALNDRKMSRAVRISGQPKATVMGVWLVLLCLANDSPERGKLMLGEDLWLEEDEIMAETGLDMVTFGKIISAFQQLNMLAVGRGYELPNWGKRQYKSDNSSARVAAYRERKKAVTDTETDVTNDVTLQKRFSHAIETDTEQIQNRTDTEAAAAVFDAYAQLCGAGAINKKIADDIGAFIDEVGAQMVLDAIHEAAVHNGKSWAYVRKILVTWRDKGRGAGKPSKPDVSILLSAMTRPYQEARQELEAAGVLPIVDRIGRWEDIRKMTPKDIEFAWKRAVVG
jgi:DnaD/phage-associated family protein